jgi:aminoglycoside phosphotransferase (APT) family kinase protein
MGGVKLLRIAHSLSIDGFAEYARSQPELAGETWCARTLGGGVSNVVLLAESTARRLVFKQALGQLRVEEEWLADRSRIHREAAAMRALAESAPRVVFEDRENFIYAMEAAPPDAEDWKTRLLRGERDEAVARRVAQILVGLGKSGDRWREEFGDQHCFDQLRLDPYYRFTASRNPDLRDAFEEAIALARRPLAMVHGDFSPKNVLVGRDGCVTLIDFEVVHYGDPAFDAAFLLNHLLLKGAQELGRVCARELAGFETAAVIRHLGCLHLARVDGKSPAEYLTEAQRGQVRAAAWAMIANPPKTIEEIFV